MDVVEVFKEVNCSSSGISFSAGTLPLWFKIMLTVWAIASLILIFLGLIGNTINYVVLKSLASESIPYRIMLWIAILDSGRLFVDIFDFPMHLLESFVGGLSISIGKICGYGHPVIMVVETYCSNTSKYLLALLSLYQVITIKRPFLRISSRVIYVIGFINGVIQLALCVPYGMAQTLYYCPDEGKMKFSFTFQVITRYRGHIESYIHPTIPMFLCIVVTCILAKEIQKANKFRAENNVSASISISKAVIKLNVIFIMCNLPHIAYAFLYFYSSAAGFTLIIKNIIIYAAVFFSCVNAAINFLVYYTTDGKFRKVMSQKIPCIESYSEAASRSLQTSLPATEMA